MNDVRSSQPHIDFQRPVLPSQMFFHARLSNIQRKESLVYQSHLSNNTIIVHTFPLKQISYFDKYSYVSLDDLLRSICFHYVVQTSLWSIFKEPSIFQSKHKLYLKTQNYYYNIIFHIKICKKIVLAYSSLVKYY